MRKRSVTRVPIMTGGIPRGARVSSPGETRAARRKCYAHGSSMRILALCGSLKARSANLSLLHVAAASAPEGTEVVLFEQLAELPHFNPDLEEAGPPPAVQEWRRAL